MATTVLQIVLATIGGIVILGGLIFVGMRIAKSSTEKIWNEGKRQAGQEFISMWDTRKNTFQDAVRRLEQEMNKQMLEAVQSTKNAGEPIVQHLLQALDENQNNPPPGSPSDSQQGEADTNAIRPPITRVK